MITPQKDKVILQEIVEKTEKHLALTKSNEKDQQVRKGKVVAVGEEVDFCWEGWTVYYTKYSGFKLELDGKEYLIIDQEQLLGREEKDE